MDKFRFLTEIAWPFLLQAGQQQHKFNAQRLIEAVLIAVATAAVTSYANQKVVEFQFAAMEKRLTVHETAIAKDQAAIERIDKESSRRSGTYDYFEALRNRPSK